jgi:hypothetical protein
MTTTTDKPAYKVGDVVAVDSPKWPGTWKVTKLLPVNVSLENTETGARLRCHPQYLIASADQRVLVESTVIERPRPRLVAGSVVEIAGGRIPDGLYVVLAETALDRYRVAKLGGDAGRYWRSVDGSRMTVVDVSRITVASE